jgi:hypothetical protein
MSRRGKNKNDSLCNSFQKLSVKNTSGNGSRAGSSKATPPTPSVVNPNLFNIKYSGSKVVRYQNLHPSNSMYEKIENLITNDRFVVENIVEVKNPFLEKAYQLKKEQKVKQFGQEVNEVLLFHGTKKANLNSICTYNFDWRLFGNNIGHKFGKGVSFSVNATYASNYSDPDDYHKVMIVAKVLIVNVCQGTKDMTSPPPGYDASQKGNNGIVVVKYEDNEFYPAYKLYYHFEEEESSSEDDQLNNYY